MTTQKKSIMQAETIHRPIKRAHVKSYSFENCCENWIEFLTPYHHLSKRLRQVFATIMAQYFRLKSQCESPAMIRTLLWSRSCRAEMRRSLNISQPHFQMALAKLRSAGALIGEDLNVRYLPPVRPDSKTFEFRVIFDYSTPQNTEKPINETVESGSVMV